jgi:hypothetical protein
MFAILSAKFVSGPMGLTKYTSEFDEGRWQLSQDQSFEKQEFKAQHSHPSLLQAMKAAARVVPADGCLNASTAKAVAACSTKQGISRVAVGGNKYTAM